MQPSKLKAAGNFVFWDSGEQYRIKFRLSDGRLIYATEGTRFTTLTKEGLISDPLLEQVFQFGAYATDLSFFGQRTIFEKRKQSFVTMVETIPEQVNSPVDFSAFVLGGTSVKKFIGENGDAFQA